MAVCNQEMTKITELSFALDELRLFLDTHPDCREALASYEKLRNQRAAAVTEYELKYGPLSSCGEVNGDTWDWSRGPWPWQN